MEANTGFAISKDNTASIHWYEDIVQFGISNPGCIVLLEHMHAHMFFLIIIIFTRNILTQL